jgi:hypothetical protein
MHVSMRRMLVAGAAGAIALAAASPALADTATTTTPAITIGQTTISPIALPLSVTTPAISAITLPTLSLSPLTTPAVGPASVSVEGVTVSTPPVNSITVGGVSTGGLLPATTPAIPSQTVDSTPKVVVPGAEVPSLTIHVPGLPPVGAIVHAVVKTGVHTAVATKRHVRHVLRHVRHVLKGVHVRVDATVAIKADALLRLGPAAARANADLGVGVHAGL